MADFERLEQQHRRRMRWLWGCTGGCLLVILLTGGLVFVFVRYLLQPVPVVPPTTFVGPRSSAFLFVRIEAGDPLMIELPARLAMSPVFQQNVPARPGGQVVRDVDQARALIEEVAPVQLVTVLEPDGEEAPLRRGGVVSLHRYSRLFGHVARGIIEQESLAAPEQHHGALIGTTLEGRAIGMRGNNYMVADQPAMLKRWAKDLEEQRRRDEPAPPRMSEPLMTAYGRLDASSPILFASVNAHGELAAILAALPEGEARQALGRAGLASPQVVSFSAELAGLNNRDAELTMFLECEAAEVAGELADRLTAVGRTFAKANPLQEIQVALHEEEERVVRVRGRLEDLPDRIAEAINYMAERHEEAERARRQAAFPAAEPATAPSP